MHLPVDPSQSTQSNILSVSSDTLVSVQEAGEATAANDGMASVPRPVGTGGGVGWMRGPCACPPQSWAKWYEALKSILPIYVGIHLAFFAISFFSVLFVLSDFSKQSMPIYTLWQSWHHWDTGNFLVVAVHGYTAPNQTAFFPLYPIFERGLMFITNNPFTAGLIISDVAGLVMLVVLYRLVEEDFDAERAYRTVLYLSVFPTAFFLAAAYNESLFICFALFSFYYMRHGNWWLAGLFGFLATLTRSSGLFLLAPFCYEYLRQHPVGAGGGGGWMRTGTSPVPTDCQGQPPHPVGTGGGVGWMRTGTSPVPTDCQGQPPHPVGTGGGGGWMRTGTSPVPTDCQGQPPHPVGTGGEVGWMRTGTSPVPTDCQGQPPHPVGTGGEVGWMRGPCACPPLLRAIRFDVIAMLGMPAAIGAFALYCYFQFNDALASLHAQAYWHPRMHIPGEGMILSLRLITHSGGLLNFQAIHNLLDLVPDLLVLGLIILSFVGPWKLPRHLWAYGLYAAALYLFFQLYPTTGIFPLLSVARYLLEVFPAFIILASLGKYRMIHMSYLMVSGATLFFLLAQFLIGRWVL